MTDPDRLADVKPLKSNEELREKTADAEPPQVPAQEEPHSLLGVLVDPLIGTDRRPDGYVPSETDESSEG